MTTETKQILEELQAIRSDLDYIKGRILDIDQVLTSEDIQSLKDAEKQLKEGRTKRLI